MATRSNTLDRFQVTGSHDDFEMSIDDLVAYLALDNYCLVPCQD